MIKHAKTSEHSDDADTTLVRPSDWNAAHVVDENGIDTATAIPLVIGGVNATAVAVTPPLTVGGSAVLTAATALDAFARPYGNLWEGSEGNDLYAEDGDQLTVWATGHQGPANGVEFNADYGMLVLPAGTYLITGSFSLNVALPTRIRVTVQRAPGGDLAQLAEIIEGIGAKPYAANEPDHVLGSLSGIYEFTDGDWITIGFQSYTPANTLSIQRLNLSVLQVG